MTLTITKPSGKKSKITKVEKSLMACWIAWCNAKGYQYKITN